MHPAPATINPGRPHRPRKRFGQHFLRDPNIIRKIVDVIAPSSTDHLVEIGPGLGALTGPLADSGARLDCIEIDRDLAAAIGREFAGRDSVSVHRHDVLRFDLEQLADKTAGEKPLRVVGNLPYRIATPVIFHLLKSHRLIRDMVFMLQLEVVQRLAASPGGRHHGRLGLMTQYFCEVEHLFNVPCSAFTPRPKVVSAMVRLRPHVRFPLTARDPECLQAVIRTAFSQRRKTLKNSLKTLLSEARLNELPIDPGLRAENLSLADYILISDAVSRQDK